jgi:hypothetical protein
MPVNTALAVSACSADARSIIIDRPGPSKQSCDTSDTPNPRNANTTSHENPDGNPDCVAVGQNAAPGADEFPAIPTLPVFPAFQAFPAIPPFSRVSSQWVLFPWVPFPPPWVPFPAGTHECLHAKLGAMSSARPTIPTIVRPTIKGRRRPHRDVQLSLMRPRHGPTGSVTKGFERKARPATAVETPMERRYGMMTLSPLAHVNSTARPIIDTATIFDFDRCAVGAMVKATRGRDGGPAKPVRKLEPG